MPMPVASEAVVESMVQKRLESLLPAIRADAAKAASEMFAAELQLDRNLRAEQRAAKEERKKQRRRRRREASLKTEKPDANAEAGQSQPRSQDESKNKGAKPEGAKPEGVKPEDAKPEDAKPEDKPPAAPVEESSETSDSPTPTKPESKPAQHADVQPNSTEQLKDDKEVS